MLNSSNSSENKLGIFMSVLHKQVHSDAVNDEISITHTVC